MVDRRAGLEFLERVPIAAALVDENAAIVGMNRRLCRLVGRTLEDVAGEHALDFVHPDDLGHLAGPLLELIGGQHPNGIALPTRIRDVDDRWIEAVCTGLDLLGEPGFAACLTLIRTSPDGDALDRRGWFEAVVGGTD